MKTPFLLLLMILGLFLTAQVPTNGLVAWYPFTGNADDHSGNGFHGTVMGASLTEDRFGNAESAYDFDGLNDYIDLSGFMHFITVFIIRFLYHVG
jgi:hypothetical protein